MQIVFLNTFEKWLPDGSALSAQLTICEQQGLWSVLWKKQSGHEDESPSIWYEGISWEEMLTAFRHGVAIQMGEGFTPIIDGMLEDKPIGRGSTVSKLQCYGELHAKPELFEQLREWRRLKALSEKKSAYLVATNRMLWMISAFVPHTPEQMRQIPGWGTSKQESYAAEVLDITREFEQQCVFPLDWVEGALEQDVYTKWLFKQKENKYKSRMDKQQLNRRILQFVKEGGTLEQLSGETGLPRRELMERIEQLEQEGYDMEPLISRELSEMPPEEQQQVWNALLEEGDKYLKPILHRVYGEETNFGNKLDIIYDRLRMLRLRFRRSADPQAM
ncbi:HRDC domain-containing protein [Paenibacillus beijingensis]|uniref:Aldolase n=1 Tax=Paenibacillus beijingensis TaxID=1126833 RepID=A0A0D5NES1_9BACL|nr:HRDC domain-containing protein [Paenibacillus beijingensis]AJY73630.1 aldolase [Paenibacillus beijingensis]